MINILVCGSKGYTDKIHIFDVLESFIKSLDKEYSCDEVTILHGGCHNCADEVVDSLRDIEDGIIIKSYPAKWEAYGKQAAYIHNEQMVNASDYVVAFWDGKSKGTKITIDLALRNPDVKKVHVENI